MAHSTISRNTALDAIGSAATWCCLCTADPGTTGGNQLAGSPRQQTTWGAAGVVTPGVKTGSAVTLDVPGGSTVTHFAVFSASTGGTFYCGGPLDSSETYTGDGDYVLTPILTD